MQQSNKSSRFKNIRNTSMGALKGLFSTIHPVIGPLLIGAWDGYQSSRLEEMIQQMSNAIAKLGEEKIDLPYILGEEFYDLFHKAARVRLLSRSIKKVKLIDGLLIESFEKDRNLRFSTALKESFLLVLDQLTDEEIIFLNEFIQDKYKEKSIEEIYQMGNSEGIVVDCLIAKGILRIDSTWGQHVVESMFGKEFVAYLKIFAKEEAL